MSLNPNQSVSPENKNIVPAYMPTRDDELTTTIVTQGGKVMQVFFEGVKSPHDMILRTPLHVCVNEACCQPNVIRHSAINPIGNGVQEVSINLRCINCDARYSRVCSPSDIHALDDRIFKAQADLESAIDTVARKNMAVDVGNMILGLRLNLFGPDDFATPRTSWIDMQPPIN